VTRYKFSHRAGGRYYWYSVVPVDSRYELISCPVAWFWSDGHTTPVLPLYGKVEIVEI
jgi:hypothetical protein